MSTRFYLPTSGSPDVTPSIQEAWDDTTQADILQMVTDKISSSFSSKQVTETSGSPYYVLTRRYISGQFEAFNFLTSHQLSHHFRCLEGSVQANCQGYIAVYVVSADGQTTRGTLKSYAFTTTEFDASNLENRGRDDEYAGENVTMQDGDRIYIEIGVYFTNTKTASQSADIEFGDNSGTDLPEDEIDQNQYNPWFEVSPTLTPYSTGETLVVADGQHSHAVDPIALTQKHTLAVVDGAHVQTVDSPVLTQAHVLAIAEALHAHSVDSPALVQAYTLAVNEALHAHAADNIALTQKHVLAVAEAVHAQTVDPIALLQAHQLAVDDADHVHLADNIVLIYGDEPTLLVVQDAFHALAADGIDLTQAHVLAINEALHGLTSDAIALVQAYALVVADALHAHATDGITLSQLHQLLVDSGLHALASDPIALSQVHNLVVSDGAHGHLADNISLAYGDLYPIIFDVLPRERIHDMRPRDRILDVDPRERIIDRIRKS